MKDKTDKCDEKQLTLRAVEGDTGILKDIVTCYGRSLLAWATTKCQDQDDAEDTVQDVYVSVQRFLPGFRGEASLRTWLYRLMLSACIRRRRGMKNRTDLHVSFSLEEFPQIQGLQLPKASDPEDVTFIKELGEVLSKALLELSENDRSIIMMKDGEGLSMREIAQKLGLGIGAVKSRLFRARAKLRTRIQKILKQRETLL